MFAGSVHIRGHYLQILQDLGELAKLINHMVPFKFDTASTVCTVTYGRVQNTYKSWNRGRLVHRQDSG